MAGLRVEELPLDVSKLKEGVMNSADEPELAPSR